MVFLDLKDVAGVAGSISAILSIVLGVYVLYSSRSKTRYNEQARRVELEVMRKSFEEKIYRLTERMQKNPDRWHDVNHLVVEGNSARAEGNLTSSGNASAALRPYQFIEDLGIDLGSLKVKENQVFVLTPFHSMYEETYGTIKSACAMNDLVAVRGDEAFKVGNILKHIIEQIICSSFIIAIINGRNPNVHYELGIAHALGKNVLLVSQGVEEIAFDLQSERVLIYKDQSDLSNKVYIYYTKILKGKMVVENYDVTPALHGWELRKAGADRASQYAATRQELLGGLADFFARKNASVKIHNEDGILEEERVYPRSADPQRTKG